MPMNRAAFLLLFFALFAHAEDLFVSYRGVFMEHRVYSQSFQVARAMVPHENRSVAMAFELPIEARDEGKTLLQFLKSKQETVIDQLFKGGVLLTDSGLSTHSDTQTKTVITLPALRLRAAIKGSFVSIAVLE